MTEEQKDQSAQAMCDYMDAVKAIGMTTGEIVGDLEATKFWLLVEQWHEHQDEKKSAEHAITGD